MRPGYALPQVFLLGALGLLLTGCTVGPDFVPPVPPKADRYTETARITASTAAPAQHLVTASTIPAAWWQLFHSSGLDALIHDALARNPDLQAAQAALRIAKENRLVGQGAYYPAVGVDFSPSRQRQSNVATSNLNSGAYIYNLFTAGVNVSFTPDVFGGTRRAVEGLLAEEHQQRFQLEATQLTLVANLAAAAIQEASLREQLGAAEDLVKTAQEIQTILSRQRTLGENSGADFVAQEALTAQFEQSLATVRKQLAEQRDLIAALSGRLPAEQAAPTFRFSDLQLPQALPVTVPSQLVAQRPDIRAAQEQWHAASAAIGVAKANRLPQLTLTAGMGGMSDKLGQLITPGNVFWNLAAGLAQPVLQGGTLLHRTRAAEAAYEQAGAQYRSTVIMAFQNVADTLEALEADAKAWQFAVAGERAAAKSLAITREGLRLGDIAYPQVLAAQQTWQQARIGLAQATAAQYADAIALFQALGGGWWSAASP